MDTNPSASPAPGPGGPGTPVDTAGIAANVQRAYAAAKAAGTPISNADLDAYVRRESGGGLGLQQLADWHAARTASPDGGAVSGPEAFFLHGTDAATFGVAPKIAALVMSLAKHGDASGYSDELNFLKSREQARSSPAGTVFGAVTNPVNYAVPGAEGARGALATGAQLARGGAVIGGLDAAGHGSGDVGTRMQQVASGALTGGLGAGLLGTGAAAAKAAIAPLLSPLARVAQAVEQSGGVQAMRDNLASFVKAGKGGVASLAALADPLGDLAKASAAKSSKAAAALADLTESTQPYDPAARLASLSSKAAKAASGLSTSDAARAAAYIGGAGVAALHHPELGGGAAGAALLAHAIDHHVAGETGSLLTTQGASAVGKLLDAIEAYHAQPTLGTTARGVFTGLGGTGGAHISLGQGGEFVPGTANERNGPQTGYNDPEHGGAP